MESSKGVSHLKSGTLGSSTIRTLSEASSSKPKRGKKGKKGKKKGKKDAGPDPYTTPSAELCEYYGLEDENVEYTEDDFVTITSLKVSTWRDSQ